MFYLPYVFEFNCVLIDNLQPFPPMEWNENFDFNVFADISHRENIFEID